MRPLFFRRDFFMTFCFHNWGFPRRRAQFGSARNVDVQSCLACGQQRVSPVQFGPEKRPVQSSANLIVKEAHEGPCVGDAAV